MRFARFSQGLGLGLVLFCFVLFSLVYLKWVCRNRCGIIRINLLVYSCPCLGAVYADDRVRDDSAQTRTDLGLFVGWEIACR